MIIKCLLSFVFLLLSFISANAQETVSMADEMRSNGKIYIVVGVIVILFLGIFSYLIRMDMKLTKLEKEILKDK